MTGIETTRCPGISTGSFQMRSGPDWDPVCRDLWDTLGDRTELKELLVERLAHRYRWWVKALVWEHDSRDRFRQSSYLGDIRCSGDSYGNPDFLDPYFVERQSPRVGRIEASITELRPDWKDTWSTIGDTWLCGAKSFRWLERIVWMIGHSRQPNDGEVIPGFLQCDDTYRNQDEAAGRILLHNPGNPSRIFPTGSE